jgi:hypothetical protein
MSESLFSPVEIVKWYRVYNDSGEEVPPFAAMQIVSADADDDGVYIIQKPDTDNQVSGILFNGRLPIRADEYGAGTFDFPCAAAFDDASTPDNGDQIGVDAGEWYLDKSHTGFFCLTEGTVVTGQKGYVSVVALPQTVTGSLTVRRADNSQSISSVTVLEVGPTATFTITGSASECLVTINSATATIAGIIDTTTQTIAGNKTFNDYIQVRDGGKGYYTSDQAVGSGLGDGGALVRSLTTGGVGSTSLYAILNVYDRLNDVLSSNLYLFSSSTLGGVFGEGRFLDGTLCGTYNFSGNTSGMVFAINSVGTSCYYEITRGDGMGGTVTYSGTDEVNAGVPTDIDIRGGLVISITKTVGHASATFTTVDGKTVTVSNGIITNVV